MSVTTAGWFEKSSALVRDLVGRPWSLYCAMLAVNALALQYAGIIHDSQLYAVQVLNRVEGGAYADDLFFCYGSQDSYSIFSVAVAPLVRVVGLRAAFFLLYLVSNSFLLLAAQYLLRTLFKDDVVVALSLLVLATRPLAYTAFGTLVVNECFLTPRIAAVGLTIVALDQMLKGRWWRVVLLLGVAGLLHPLMAFGGVLMAMCWWAVERFGWRWTLSGCAGLAVAVAGVLAWRPLGTALLGPLDEEWRDYARRAVPMNFPSEWGFYDWLPIGAGLTFAFGLGLAPSASTDDRRRARFAQVVGFVSVVAVAGTVVAEWLPYALPLQGQPYRALWLLRLVQAPFGLQQAANLWRRPAGYGKLGAVAIAGYLGAVSFAPLEFSVMAIAALAVALWCYRGFSDAPTTPDWLPRSILAGILVGATAWAGLRIGLVLGRAGEFLQIANPAQYGTILLGCLGFVGWAAVGLAMLAVCQRVLGLDWRFRTITCGLFLMCQLGAMAMLCVWEVPSRRISDFAFVGRFVEEQKQGDGRLATVYCAVGEAGDVWLTVHAKSYFTRQQICGNLFSRRTAMEGQRRARLLGRFEHERVRCYVPLWTDSIKRNQEELFEAPLDVGAPRLADLVRLCAQDGLDYVAVAEAFEAPHAITNGRIYIYDCKTIRALLGTAAAQAAAPRGGATRATGENQPGISSCPVPRF